MTKAAKLLIGAVGAAVIVAAIIFAALPSGSVRDAGQISGGRAAIAVLRRPSEVLWVGDSYTGGTGSTDGVGGYVGLTSKHFGWSWATDAEGGTGYVNNGHDNQPNYEPVLDRLATDRREYPTVNLVVIDVGRNDGVAVITRVEKAAITYFNAVTAAWPHARVLVIAPFYVGKPPTFFLTLREFERAQAKRRHWYFIDPLAQGWISQHNPKDLIFTDHVHPSELGHQYIAAHLEADIAEMHLPSAIGTSGPLQLVQP